jgi:hypothetical protein
LRDFGDGYLFYYALGTGEYTYQKQVFAFLDISMPAEWRMEQLYLDEMPYPFAMTSEENEDSETQKIVSIYAKVVWGGFTKDIIGHIVPGGKRFDQDSDEPDFEDLDVDHSAKARRFRGQSERARRSRWQSARAGRSRWQSTPVLRYKVEQCGTTEQPLLATSISARGEKLLVSDPIFFNCCAEYVRMTMVANADKVVFREKAMEEAPCDCVCYYPMRGVAGPFEPGTYEVELLDPHGDLILRRDIEIQ